MPVLISAALQRKKKRLYVHIPHLHQTVRKNTGQSDSGVRQSAKTVGQSFHRRVFLQPEPVDSI